MANRSARTTIEHNKGEAISAFDDPYWRRYYYQKCGWLQDVIDGSRDMAKALDKYADAGHAAIRLPMKQPLADDQDAWLGHIYPSWTTVTVNSQ
ncbi:hypothetical protein ACWGDS_42415 [Streptomyces sp. NPDC055059]|uniref:Uncharacterized protein n=1 Tax=Streptomyces sp. NBC_00119 TaxID=2975659 RepID=A0AAU1UJ95_9ACTN|nr:MULTISPECIES: hypothetical protein [unclassified Streptomyces]MCX4647573.1 hypothetical protein [Streptomyces sp. NBC_01446]MCX5320148.1 hypothetical protein [Streptomyces sp. NBC_00120]